ncbi:AAA family ATPase [Methylobacterium persicinum]
MKVVASGKGFLPVVGEVYEVRGEWRWSDQYGEQLHGDGDTFRRLMPSGALLRPWLERIPGVGPERAKRLLRAFEGNLDHVFDGGVSIEKLASIIDPERPNLATRVAVAITHEWERVKGEYDAMRWLEEQGVEDPRTARTISRLLGPMAVATLSRNPYVLASVIPWTRLDPVAQRVLLKRGDVPSLPTCEARIVGATDVVMQDAVRRGHTAVAKIGFAAEVAKRLGLECSPDLSRMIISAGLKTRAIVDGSDRWRAPGCAIMEEEILARFRDMAAGLERTKVRIPPPRDLRRVLAMVERRGRDLFPEQRDAVVGLVERPISCLTGGAGTGKTTTCRAVVDLWEALGGRVELAALSGKAALRLGQGVERVGENAPPALTLHKLLMGLRKRRDGETHWGKPPDEGEPPAPGRELPALTDRTLLILDEASMIDLGQMHQVVEAMPAGCRLMLVGDAFQLPPVGFGLVFHHVVAQESVTARLQVVRRQEDSSGIPAVSKEIRSLSRLSLAPYARGRMGVSFLPAAQGRVSAAIERVVDDLGGFASGPDDLLVLAAVNRRAAQPDGTVSDLNVRLQRRAAGHGGGGGRDPDRPVVRGCSAATLRRGIRWSTFGTTTRVG